MTEIGMLPGLSNHPQFMRTLDVTIHCLVCYIDSLIQYTVYYDNTLPLLWIY